MSHDQLDPEPNAIYWEEVTEEMNLEAREGSWFADNRLVYWTGQTAAYARARLGTLYQKQKAREKKPDLELKALEHFSGTEQYHKVLGFNVTDGVHYLMENGYSYLVTDVLAVFLLRPRLKNADFLVINYRVDLEKHQARLEVRADTNQPLLYSQNYPYTDAKRALVKMFYESGVLLLANEH